MSLIKGASTIGGASVISQVIGAFTILFMSYRFGMSDVGNYSLIYGIILIGAQVALYGSHFLLPKVDQQDLGKAVVFGLLQSWIVSAAYIFVVSYFFSLPLMAIYVLTASYAMMIVSENILLRSQKFQRLAVQRISVTSIVSLSLLISWKVEYFYYIWAFAHLILICYWLYSSLDKNDFTLSDFSPTTQVKFLFKHWNHLSRVGTAEVVANASLQLPTVLINYWFSPLVAGYFAVVNRFCLSPVLILGQSVRNYTFSKWSEDFRNKTFNYVEFKQVRLFLISIALITVAGIYFVYPWLTEHVLGEQWVQSVETSRLMLPYVFAMLAFVPMTVIELIFGTPNYFLRIQCEQLAIVIIAFILIPFVYKSYVVSLLMFTVLTAARYLMIYIKINKDAVKLHEEGIL
ncbi:MULTISPECIES: lipopolysaccharide biosynthesis protein [Gammaproteobacteria]|uniref:lipopolysaccharide biosynthesis protein n=1 Tax=Gammaproteobacteria TaxID=1236 RepID=UPI000D070ADA|nr:MULTISPECIES: capsular biosynthesis protein [Gammaproteobacteria]EHA1082317.1 capsular biosynthesis protein [Photobacterium damselae]KAB1183743.1 capsular biosynthesis protein [Photobacterium damselae subsp. damselae]MBF7101456.1 capsular biosynthesis protein [Photobacterium damselae]MCG3812457.1 capsular biosynthesis protein [Photobacterium damselae]MCG3880417.1 capsular biosynthesis protein [Psychrobacter sp. Ps6]